MESHAAETHQKFLLQTHGTNMGTMMAATSANVFMTIIENLYRDRVVLTRNLVTRRFFRVRQLDALVSIGYRPTDLWPKAKVTRGEATRKTRERKLFE